LSNNWVEVSSKQARREVNKAKKTEQSI